MTGSAGLRRCLAAAMWLALLAISAWPSESPRSGHRYRIGARPHRPLLRHRPPSQVSSHPGSRRPASVGNGARRPSTQPAPVTSWGSSPGSAGSRPWASTPTAACAPGTASGCLATGNSGRACRALSPMSRAMPSRPGSSRTPTGSSSWPRSARGSGSGDRSMAGVGHGCPTSRPSACRTIARTRLLPRPSGGGRVRETRGRQWHLARERLRRLPHI